MLLNCKMNVGFCRGSRVEGRMSRSKLSSVAGKMSRVEGSFLIVFF